MRILHVGWGMQPFRGGGLIEYAEDLMEIQAENGYQVSYFCTGRFSVISNKPALKKWQNNKGYTVYELWNPPVINGFESGVENPLTSVSETVTGQYFFEVIKEISPDIVHIQEFIGIPTQILIKLKALNIKTVFTIEDYFYLCPTVKLILPDGSKCRIKGSELGKQCEICCSNALRNTLNYRLHVMYPSLYRNKLLNGLKKVRKSIIAVKSFLQKPGPVYLDDKKAEEFNLRRQFNLEAFQHIDLVIAMSNKVADIFSYYKPVDHMITLNLTLKHISKIKPVRFDNSVTERINFAIINALNTKLKGRDILFELFEMINSTAWKHKVSFQVMGHIKEADERYLKKYPFVNCVGKFNADDLDMLFNKLNIHVGMVPSVWEEAYGYVGVEFLAKGIPVIGNNIGGIPDYVNSETGWLNDSCDAAGLFAIVRRLAQNPSAIQTINKSLTDTRRRYIKSMETHFTEMDDIYKKLLITPIL